MTTAKERHYAALLVGWLNEEHRLKLELDPEDEPEGSPIDVRATDKTTGTKLEFQNVAYRVDNVFPKTQGTNPTNMKIVLTKAMTGDRRRDTLVALINKKKKKYAKEVRDKLILIVEISMPSVSRRDIEHLPRTNNYGFKAIYFVQLPVFASTGTTRAKEGFVVPLIPLPYEKLGDADSAVPRIGEKIMRPVFEKAVAEMQTSGGKQSA